MRAIFLILILAVVAIIAAIATGLVNINQIRGAQVPQVSATHNGVVAKGGQTPAFDVETGSVSVGSREAKVKVPALKINRPGDKASQAQENQAAPSAVNGM